VSSLTDIYNRLLESLDAMRRLNLTIQPLLAGRPPQKESAADLTEDAVVTKVMRALAANPHMDDATLDLIIEAQVRRMFECANAA